MNRTHSKLLIKVSADPRKDLKLLASNPAKYARPDTHIAYVKTFDDVRELLSVKRLEIYQYLAHYPESAGHSVSQIAENLNRKQEAISRDVSILSKNGLIMKERRGNSTIINGFKSIEIQFA